MNACLKALRMLGFAGAVSLASAHALGQTNVIVHYANGQVWVVWQVEQGVLTNCIPTFTPALSNGVPVTISNCLPQTYAIYWSPHPLTNTATAALVGRLFEQEWSAEILRNDIGASF